MLEAKCYKERTQLPDPAGATTLKMRNRWLAFADEQEWIAQSYEKAQEKTGRQWPNSIARHRASAERYRLAAAAYKPQIEGED